jgi:dolichyl-phosphate-mannose-protein mannosyltransferase
VRPRSGPLFWICLLVAAQALFLIGIDSPRAHNFDESHYVPAARRLVALQADPNPEHPPLGKMLIGLGVTIFGDRPLGWRVTSTVFGTVTLAGMFAWALALFRDRTLALWAALLTLVNHLLYVQARVAMLDTFMFAFLAWASAAVTAAWNADERPERKRRYLGFAGWMLGLAAATKWSGLFCWAACLALIGTTRFVESGTARSPVPPGGRRPPLLAGISHRDIVRTLIVYPLVVYALCFVPRIAIEHQGPWYTALADLVDMQTRMYDEQLRVPGQHAYLSQWYQWPLLQRPIWYAFERDGTQVRAVLLLGNPVVMWGGMVALVVCAIGWLRRRSRESFLILFFYLSFLLPWIVLPRPLSLYYYYYPAGMTLSLALAYVFRERTSIYYRRGMWAGLAIAAAVFAYFFPVLSGTPIGDGEFARWMWFRTWI